MTASIDPSGQGSASTRATLTWSAGNGGAASARSRVTAATASGSLSMAKTLKPRARRYGRFRPLPQPASSTRRARIEPATQQLVEQVNVDLAKDRVKGRGNREVFAHDRTPPL